MAIETYTRKPRGFSHVIIKYRVRIRSHLDDDTPVKVDELYDTLSEAKAAEERHWLSIRTGALSKELTAQLWRLQEPSIGFLLEMYAKYETPKRAESGRKLEKTRLEKTIPGVKGYVGKADKLEERLKPNTPTKGIARIGDVIAAACTRQIVLDYIRARSKTASAATVRREIGLRPAVRSLRRWVSSRRGNGYRTRWRRKMASPICTSTICAIPRHPGPRRPAGRRYR